MVEGTSVDLTATGTVPGDAALAYEWDLDNNGSYETAGQSVSFSARPCGSDEPNGRRARHWPGRPDRN